ncbi:MAG: ROK family protein, partial [Candidatus Margulisiibacteriota bacterium]
YIIAADLGGTKIQVVLADEKGKCYDHLRIPTDSHLGQKEIIRKMEDAILEIVNNKPASILSIGICAPGPVDFAKGIVSNPPNLPGWKNVKLGELLKRKFHVPVMIDNDANCAALAEAKFGAGKGIKNFVYVTISTGIGGGIIIDGKLYRGAVGAAGEIGHTIMQKNGPLCGCGQHGHFEAMASGTAVQRMFGHSAIELSLALKENKQWAKEALNELADNIGIGFANVVNILNPELIIVGGGLSNLGEKLLKPVRAYVKKYALPLPASSVKIAKAKLGTKAEVLGAVALCL